MSQTPDSPPPKQGPPARAQSLRQTGAAIAIVAALLMTVAALLYYFYFPAKIGPQQPIPFSHRFHVSTKQLNCVFCHTGAIDTPRSGVPPLETCMLCHKQIIVDYPYIKTLREHYDSGRPVEWVRVNDVPDYVFFNHQVHVRAGFDCSRCHGDVAQMDRVSPAYDLKMGFCVQCHRDNNYSHDCYICHR